MRIFGVANEDAALTMDKFFVVSQQTGIPLDKLTKTMQTFGPILKNMGFTMDEATAIFGKFNAAGVDASRVMPALNKFARDAAKEGVTDIRASLEFVIKEMQNMGDGAVRLGYAVEQFGAEGAQRLITAIDAGAFSLDGMVNQLGLSEGAILANAEATRTNTEKLALMRTEISERLAGAWRSLPGPVQATGLALGGVGSAAGPLLVALPGLVTATRALSLANAKQAVTSGISAAATVARTVVTAAQTVATIAATVATAAFGVALTVATGPIGLIVLAITGLIAIGVLLYKNWDEISAKAKEIWNAIKAFFTETFEAIQTTITETWEEIAFFLGFQLDNIFLQFTEIWNAVSDFLLETWETIVGFIRKHWRTILAILFPAAGLAALIVKHWGPITDIVKGIWDGAVAAVKGAVNHILGFINKMIDAWNSITFTVPTVTIPFVGTFGGMSFSVSQIPRIPLLAEGGIVTGPTLALLGEAGPEAIIPLGRGGGVGGGITIMGDVYGWDDFVDKVGEAGIELEERGG